MDTEQRAAEVIDCLRTVLDPEIRKDIVTLNMVRDVSFEGATLRMRLVLTTPACPLKDRIQKDVEEAVIGSVDGIDRIEIAWDADTSRMPGLPGRKEIPGVRNTIAVCAGKGGVGKSTVAVNIAFALQREGAKVGILDADIYGPNIPIMLGVEDAKVMGTDESIMPVEAHGLKIISIGMMLEKGKPAIFRGPILGKALRDFLYTVDWGDLDYLLIDLPPGTGDVQLTLAQSAPVGGALIVTTPQDVSVSDVARGITMFQQLNVPVLGIVENMSTFVCPHCGEPTSIFGEGGGTELADRYGLEILGRLPLDPQLRIGGDNGLPYAVSHPEGPVSAAFTDVATKLAGKLSTVNLRASKAPVMPNGPRIPVNR